MNQKQTATLRKVHGLAAAPGTDAEGIAAFHKLRDLCKKHEVRLSDYIEDLKNVPDLDYRPEAAEEAETAARNAAADKTACMLRSRRNFIIVNISDNIWNMDSLANAIKACFPQYADLAKNKKAIHGTMNDMKKKGWTCKVCDDKRMLIKTS